MLVECGEELLYVRVDAEVEDLEAGTLEHHPDQVLADVVDVALDGADYHLADRLCTGLGEQRTEDGHAGLHGVCRQQHLGDEEDAVPEVDAHDPHAGNQGVVEHARSIPAPTEQDLGPFDDLVGEAVVEVVVHLCRQVFVGKVGEDDLLVGKFLSHRHTLHCGSRSRLG